SLAALAPPTPQMARSTATKPMYTPTHLLRSSLSLFRRSMMSSIDMVQAPQKQNSNDQICHPGSDRHDAVDRRNHIQRTIIVVHKRCTAAAVAALQLSD